MCTLAELKIDQMSVDFQTFVLSLCLLPSDSCSQIRQNLCQLVDHNVVSTQEGVGLWMYIGTSVDDQMNE